MVLEAPLDWQQSRRPVGASVWQLAALFLSEVFSPTPGAEFVNRSLQALLQSAPAYLKVQACHGSPLFLKLGPQSS